MVIRDGIYDSSEGWTYHIDNKEIFRTSTGTCPSKPTSATDPNMITEWLIWTHEATVVEVAQMGSRKVVLTFKTGQSGMMTRNYNGLVNRWNVFVGFVPAGIPPE